MMADDNQVMMNNCLNESKQLLVMPGDCLLKHQNNIIASNGTYLKNDFIYSSMAGYLQITEQNESHFDDLQNKTVNDDAETKSMNEDNNDSLNTSSLSNQIITKRIVKVIRPGNDCQIPFLEPGSIVTCRITRITSSFAKCSIIRLDDIHDGISAQQQRLRHVNRCFRPGDIILARVIAAGDNHQFLLTTATSELGVVVAYYVNELLQKKQEKLPILNRLPIVADTTNMTNQTGIDIYRTFDYRQLMCDDYKKQSRLNIVLLFCRQYTMNYIILLSCVHFS
ncbi:Exosome complex component CSL4 [Dermatophagoides pteronyssinus]|uniref:Exosome complex component CSL4 n=1 Tax=Dermatophagoides pteronyssinus TaxID=6956 RepID=A0ABQ8JLA1_DERPT|nr:Exosome complex component CSL4 [Dermatophagoides pteronyssinus]